MPNNIYTWEYNDSKNRSAIWYIIALSVVFGLTIWGFFTGQYGMSFIVLLITGIAYFVENNSDDTVIVKITEFGISIAGGFFDFTSIKSFGVVYKGETPVSIRIYLNKKSLSELNIKIDTKNLNDIKNILSEYIEEIPKIELTLIEKLIEKLKL